MAATPPIEKHKAPPVTSLPHPNFETLQQYFSIIENFDTLHKLVLSDLENTKKTGHWIWYIYPQSKEDVESVNPTPHYEAETSSELKNFMKKSKNFKTLFRKVNWEGLYERPLKWFANADKGRVKAFRERYSLASTFDMEWQDAFDN